jgi:hypothetical protein
LKFYHIKKNCSTAAPVTGVEELLNGNSGPGVELPLIRGSAACVNEKIKMYKK